MQGAGNSLCQPSAPVRAPARAALASSNSCQPRHARHEAHEEGCRPRGAQAPPPPACLLMHSALSGISLPLRRAEGALGTLASARSWRRAHKHHLLLICGKFPPRGSQEPAPGPPVTAPASPRPATLPARPASWDLRAQAILLPGLPRLLALPFPLHPQDWPCDPLLQEAPRHPQTPGPPAGPPSRPHFGLQWQVATECPG